MITINVIVYRNKCLFRTISSDIYQNENRSDCFKFLVNKNDISSFDPKRMQCVLCITLPDKTNGKISFLSFDNDETHDGYLSSTIPITKVITKDFGHVEIFLIFSYEDDESLFHNLPTNKVYFDILESDSFDSFIDPDETKNPFSELGQRVENLENHKISTADINDNAIVFYSDLNKENIIGIVQLPSDVTWTNMEE